MTNRQEDLIELIHDAAYTLAWLAALVLTLAVLAGCAGWVYGWLLSICN